MAMQGINKIDTLDKIPTGNYEGYYWLSDAEQPILVNDKNKFDASKIGINPFIIEGMLWDDVNKISIMISHTGKYQIWEYKLIELEGEKEEKEYMAHRLDGISKVCFTQLWQEEPDANCEGMLALKMKAQIFTGFKKIK
jgi:CRISPR type III-associated protein (TIGR04423 family)